VTFCSCALRNRQREQGVQSPAAMIRILALVHKPLGLAPGQRFRIEQWAPLLLSRYGISVDFSVYESPQLTRVLYEPGKQATKAAYVLKDTLRRTAVLSLAKDYDAIVVYREASLFGPALYERLLARLGKPIIFDFDDAIWLHNTGSLNGWFSRLRFPGKTATICRLASAVVVGNTYLATYARRLNGNVSVIPSTIDLKLFPVQPPLQSESPFVIVWSGSLSTLRHLETARQALERFARKRKTVLRIISSRPPERAFAGLELEFIPWSADSEAANLGESHVGIMPLPDDEFTRGKGGFKALLYMSVGRPVVASPVGVNAEIVTSGTNGFLANTEDEWVSALDALAESPSLRNRLAQAARATVEGGYSADLGAAAFAAVVNEVLHGSMHQNQAGAKGSR
jgi:glycosyltransferase involved in cell wall biosynthesis